MYIALPSLTVKIMPILTEFISDANIKFKFKQKLIRKAD